MPLSSFLEKHPDFVLKLKIKAADGQTQIRRVRLPRITDGEGNVSYEELVGFVAASSVPEAQSSESSRYNVSLTYHDVDGDSVTIGSSEELVDACEQYVGQKLLRIDTSSQPNTTVAPEELIDNNTCDRGRSRQSTSSVAEGSPPQHLYDPRTGAGRSGIEAHLTPTKRKRKVKGVVMEKQFHQGWCVVCASKYKGKRRKGFKTSFLCSRCNDEASEAGAAESQVWLCHSKYGRNCFAEHMAACHCS
ncbi:PB1 domain containing protein [Nitzschia inconspicua]|uniref:PB1 domain containing protein n=1 Tax=Nitzschia inconspicua TaxID=303405 RepID=A0A9K3Q863_9STRA|nr:PB1 domain containing protein [Nitzschia inconspicua]